MKLILALSFWQSFYVFQILHRFFTVTSTKWRTLVFVIQKFAFWFYIKLEECSLSKLLTCNTNTDNVRLYIFSLKLFRLFMLLCVFFSHSSVVRNVISISSLCVKPSFARGIQYLHLVCHKLWLTTRTDEKININITRVNTWIIQIVDNTKKKKYI